MQKFSLILVTLLLPISAAAAWPLPADAPPEAHADAGSWPSDPNYAQQYWLWSHTAEGEGASVDRAWSLTRGSPSVVISVVGAGVSWESKDLANKWALSVGELLPPQDATGAMASDGGHDRNGDGRFNAQDYTSATGTMLPLPSLAVDPRLTIRPDDGDVNGNGLIDPEDLLAIFGDGFDGDGNGLVDDLCGYDFARSHANARSSIPVDDTRNAELAAAQTNDGIGYAGACPECMVLPLRVSQAGLSGPDVLSEALRYSSSRGSRVAIVSALPVGRTAALETLLKQVNALVVFAPVLRPGVRLESLDGAGHTLRADPLGPQRSVPAGASSSVSEHLRVAPTEAPAAVLGGVAGLLISHAPNLRPIEMKSALLVSAVSGRLNAREAIDGTRSTDAFFFLYLPEIIEPVQLAHLAVAKVPVRINRSGGTEALFLEAAPGINPPSFKELSRFDAGQGAELFSEIDPSSLSFPPSLLEQDPFANAMTVRVRAQGTRRDGGIAELSARRTVFFTRDPDLKPPFPISIPGAGATALKLVDVDGDSSDDLVVVSGDGVLHVLDQLGALLFTFPLGGPGYAPPAIADVDGDGLRDIAVSSLNGRLSVVDSAGVALPGFPVVLDRTSDGGSAVELYAAPVIHPSRLGALIIQGDSAGHVHVFVDDGSELAGSPVVIGSSATPIVGTPAVGDVDNNGWPDIIVGTAELSETAAETTVFRLSVDPQGVAVVPEFQVKLPADPAFGGVLDRRGLVSSPLIANLDRTGQREIILRSTGSALRVFRSDGTEVVELAQSKRQDVPSMAAVADLNGDGPFELIDHEQSGRLKAWGAGKQLQLSGGSLSIGAASLGVNYPINAPAPALGGFVVADVNGDREPDIVFASEDPVVHAFTGSGKPVEGWPRQLPGGSNAHIAIGVMGGRLSVAALTRDGRIYVWNVLGIPRDIQWDSFHHDPANTGSTATALPDRELPGIGVRRPPLSPAGCCSGAPAPFSVLGLVALLMSLKLARVRREE